jgi:hypothetical protein
MKDVKVGDIIRLTNPEFDQIPVRHKDTLWTVTSINEAYSDAFFRISSHESKFLLFKDNRYNSWEFTSDREATDARTIPAIGEKIIYRDADGDEHIVTVTDINDTSLELNHVGCISLIWKGDQRVGWDFIPESLLQQVFPKEHLLMRISIIRAELLQIEDALQNYTEGK